MAAAYDMIVIGAGAIGLTIAWRARQQGMSVALVERDQAGSGASGVAAGMLAPVTEASFGEEALVRLNVASSMMFPAMLEDLKASCGEDLRELGPGTITVAIDKDRAQWLRRLHELQTSLDLEAELLDADRCRQLEPYLHPRVRAGVLAPKDFRLDPRRLVDALHKSCIDSGVEVLQGEGRIDSSRAEPAVELAHQTLRSAAIVIAAGAWSPTITGAPPELKAIRPVKGQMLRCRSRSASCFDMKHVVRSDEVYVVPRSSGEVVIGATVEEQGFDTSVTAGAVFELLRSAEEIVPAIRELEFIEANAGSRPATIDNLPMIGPTSIGGIFAAAGHFRNGILLSPITAELVLNSLAGSPTPPELDPRRFIDNHSS